MHDQHIATGSLDLSTYQDHVVLCGLGTAGVRIAEGLLRAGTRLIVVDNGPITPFRRSLAHHGVPIIVGDCTEPETLHQAGIGRASALLVVINNDMVNLQTALVAREINARARIVIRLFNQRMAQHLHALPAQIGALSLSAASAPIFVLAARCRSLRGALSIGGALYALGSLTVPHDPPDTTLEQWRSLGLVPVACTTPDGCLTLRPDASYVPPPGSRLLVIAQAQRLLVLDQDPTHLHQALRDPSALDQITRSAERNAQGLGLHTRLIHAVTGLRLLWTRANRLLRMTLVTILMLVGTSIAIFYIFLGISPVDALYLTVTLITTVGLSDITFRHEPAPIELFGAFVMLGGATLMAVVYALIAQFVLEARFEELMGTRPDVVRDHYVVAGLGTVGFRVVSELLAAGERVVVIESADTGRFIPQLKALSVPLVVGDAALEETLRRAQIAQARALIAVTNDDLANMEAVLNARAIQPDLHLVLRVFDPTLAAQARQGFAIPASLSASLIGAHEFVCAALGYEAPQVLELPLETLPGDHTAVYLTILQVQGEAGDGRCGRLLTEIAADHDGMIVLYLPGGPERQVCFSPDAADRLQPGDHLVLAVPGRDPLGIRIPPAPGHLPAQLTAQREPDRAATGSPLSHLQPRS